MAMFPNPDDALIERVVVRRTDDVVELREAWNLKHPSCPFVSAVFRDTFPRKILMTPAEYDCVKPPIKKRRNSSLIKGAVTCAHST